MTDVRHTIDLATSDLIALIMEQRNYSMGQAFKLLYSTRLYDKLQNPNTGLFYQSDCYNYELLEEEINGKK